MSNELSYRIIGAAMEVHKCIGPGMLESVYEKCLAEELSHRKIKFRKQIEMPLIYRGVNIESGFRLDFLIEDEIILELKAVEFLLPIHEAQLLTYLKICKKNIGLLINFNSLYLKYGLKRFILKK